MPQVVSARKILCSFVYFYSKNICYSVDRCKLLFVNEGHAHLEGVDLLIKAVDREIPAEMVRLVLRKNMPISYLMPKFTRWLSRDENMAMDNAVWAVNSWAMALGLVAFMENDCPRSRQISISEAVF